MRHEESALPGSSQHQMSRAMTKYELTFPIAYSTTRYVFLIPTQAHAAYSRTIYLCQGNSPPSAAVVGRF